MKKTQLTNILREIIREELDNLTEGLMDKLPGKMNPAVQQAHQQGLHSIGFGRWANAQGHYVAKTVNGKLQNLDPRDTRTQPKDRNPKTMPLNRGVNQGGPASMADPVNMKAKVHQAVRTKLGTAFKSSAVQRAAKIGGELTGAQMTKLTGVPEKAYKVASYTLTPGDPAAERSVAIDYDTALDYNPTTKMYRFRDSRVNNN
jgi:hypothetical protein